MAGSLHPDFCTQGQGQVGEGVKHPFCPCPSLRICVQPPKSPRTSPGSRNALSPPPVSCRTSASAAAPVFGLNSTPLCILWLQGSWCPPGPLLFDCLWPSKGAHIHPLHSSASTPAYPVFAAQCPSPPLLTSLSFRCSTEKSN